MSKISPFLFINMTTTACCLVFLLFTFMSYFTKKNMNNLENKIYKNMLIINLLCLLAYVGFYGSAIITVSTNHEAEWYWIVYIFSKLAPIPIIGWYLFLLFYLIVIINEKNVKATEFIKKNEKKIFHALYIVIAIIGIIGSMEKSVLLIEKGMEENLLIVMNASLYTIALVDIVLIVLYGNRIENRKGWPFYSMIPMGILTSYIGFTDLKIALLYVVMTLLDNLMFNTIENPDVKMLNEMTLAKDQAEKSSKAKTDFLSSMSHEIRTPLNAIVGLAQMIDENDNIEEMKSDSRDIIVASQNLMEIVNGILDINKIDAGKMDIIASDYEIRKEFESIIKMIKIRIGEKPIELKVNYQENLPLILNGDIGKIKQVATNFLTNAVKYTDSGVVTLDLSLEKIKDKNNLRILVRDTGRGIKEDQKEKLFTKFNRLEEDKDSNIEGTGLGLSITKSLIELLDGNIEVETTYGVGSTFIATIPQKIVKENYQESEPVEELL